MHVTGLQYFDLHFGVSTVSAYNEIFAKCARIDYPHVLIPVKQLKLVCSYKIISSYTSELQYSHESGF
jgi:hypothetical protein